MSIDRRGFFEKCLVGAVGIGGLASQFTRENISMFRAVLTGNDDPNAMFMDTVSHRLPRTLALQGKIGERFGQSIFFGDCEVCQVHADTDSRGFPESVEVTWILAPDGTARTTTYRADHFLDVVLPTLVVDQGIKLSSWYRDVVEKLVTQLRNRHPDWPGPQRDMNGVTTRWSQGQWDLTIAPTSEGKMHLCVDCQGQSVFYECNNDVEVAMRWVQEQWGVRQLAQSTRKQ